MEILISFMNSIPRRPNYGIDVFLKYLLKIILKIKKKLIRNFNFLSHFILYFSENPCFGLVPSQLTFF